MNEPDFQREDKALLYRLALDLVNSEPEKALSLLRCGAEEAARLIDGLEKYFAAGRRRADAPAEAKLVRCVVPCHNANGEPDLFFVDVACTDHEYENGEHYAVARTAAEELDYVPADLGYDEHDPGFGFLSKAVLEDMDVPFVVSSGIRYGELDTGNQDWLDLWRIAYATLLLHPEAASRALNGRDFGELRRLRESVLRMLDEAGSLAGLPEDPKAVAEFVAEQTDTRLLDSAVHAAASREAVAANNGGPEAQIRFLMLHGYYRAEILVALSREEGQETKTTETNQ